MTAMDDTVSQLNILLPKILGSMAGAFVGAFIGYLTKHYGWAVDPALQSMLNEFFTGLGTLLGYSLTAILTTAKTNPANVASTKAVVPPAQGKPNVTADPEVKP